MYFLRSQSSHWMPLAVFLPVLHFPEPSFGRFCLEELVVCNQQERRAVFTSSSPEPKVLSLTFLMKLLLIKIMDLVIFRHLVCILVEGPSQIDCHNAGSRNRPLSCLRTHKPPFYLIIHLRHFQSTILIKPLLFKLVSLI